VTVTTHWLSGNMTEQVWRLAQVSALPVVAGASLGFYLDRFIDAGIFRKLVLGLLFILGLNLSFSWLKLL